jgi:uncharacterized protein (DUF58 family)
MRKKFRSLELTARRLLSSFGSGSHVSLLKDSIIDVDVTRQYQPGDKKLDSRSSLRSSQTMSRVFTPEKAMTLFMVVDVSASQFSKLEQTVTTCLYLTYLADLANDKIGLLTFSDRVHTHVLPSNDQREVVPALEKTYDNPSLGTHTDLDKVLSYMGGLQLDNTLIVLISDFCYPITDRSVMLAKRSISNTTSNLIALAMVNQDEWQLDDLPFSVNFKDAESENNTTWNCSNNEGHRKVFENWQSNLKVRLRQARAEPIIMPVNRSDYLLPLVKYFVRG